MVTKNTYNTLDAYYKYMFGIYYNKIKGQKQEVNDKRIAVNSKYGGKI